MKAGMAEMVRARRMFSAIQTGIILISGLLALFYWELILMKI